MRFLVGLRRRIGIGRIVGLRLGRIAFVGGLGRGCGRQFGCIALESGIGRSMVAVNDFVGSRTSGAGTVAGSLFDIVAASDCLVGWQSMEVEAFGTDPTEQGWPEWEYMWLEEHIDCMNFEAWPSLARQLGTVAELVVQSIAGRSVLSSRSMIAWTYLGTAHQLEVWSRC